MRLATRLLVWLPLLIANVAGAPPALAETIEIGLAVPLTGPFTVVGRQFEAGAQAAVALVNNNGGVRGGRKLALRLVDDRCDHQRAAAVARSLATRKVPVVLGHACPAASLAAAPVYAATGILMMSPAVLDPLLSETMWSNRPNVYRIGAGAERQGHAAALYLGRRFGHGQIAIVRDRTAYGNNLARGVQRGLAAMGFEVKVQAFSGEHADVDAAIDSIGRPAAVFVAGSARAAAQFIGRAKERGLDAVFAAGDAVLSPEFLGAAEEAAEDVLSTSPLDARQLASAQQAAALLRESGFEPEGYTLYAFVAVQVIAQAIDRARTTDFTGLKRALDTQSFATAFGRLRFIKGDIDLPLFGFSQWREGRPGSFEASPHWDFAADGATAVAGLEPVIKIIDKNVLRKASKDVRPVGKAAPDRVSRMTLPERLPPRATPRAIQGVFWNTFFTREGELDARPRAGSKASYTLVLDLSAYNYRQITETNAAGTAVDARVRSHLESASQEPVELRIRLVMVTPEFVLDQGQAPVETLRVQRRRLVRPRDGAAARVEEQLIQDFQEDSRKVLRFSASVSAGRVPFRVRLAEDAAPGCAVIAFTIWDIHDNPLDHLLRTVAIDGSSPTQCQQENRTAEALKGGFATFLSPVFSIGTGDAARPIHAALHIFETKVQGRNKSVAILVDRSRGAAPQAGAPGGDPAVYTWRQALSLSDYVASADGLPFQIGEAWNAANLRTPAPYAQAADELARWIFGAEPADRDKAEAARTALRRIADAASAPVVLVRLIGADNRKLYVPLGLIAAAGNTEGLSKPITIVQPLAVERYSASRCIQTWSVAMSSETSELDDSLKPELDKLADGKPDSERWYESQKKLRDYLATGTERPPVSAPGHGLVLLAHHDSIGMYINDRVRRIGVNGFLRRYPFGSVALLASCATSNPSSDTTILDRLNEHGIDAAIVSPFKVQLRYAARLAYEFTQIVRHSRSNRLTPTLADMFAQASTATAAYFTRVNPLDTALDASLEFVLVGNPYLRLCAP